jgi:hypothetical protein
VGRLVLLFTFKLSLLEFMIMYAREKAAKSDCRVEALPLVFCWLGSLDRPASDESGPPPFVSSCRAGLRAAHGGAMPYHRRFVVSSPRASDTGTLQVRASTDNAEAKAHICVEVAQLLFSTAHLIPLTHREFLSFPFRPSLLCSNPKSIGSTSCFLLPCLALPSSRKRSTTRSFTTISSTRRKMERSFYISIAILFMR